MHKWLPWKLANIQNPPPLSIYIQRFSISFTLDIQF